MVGRMTGTYRRFGAASRTTRLGAFAVLLGAMALGSAGCSHPAEPEAAPPPRADAQPLPVVQGKQPRPKLPPLAGDTHARPATPGP